MQFSLDTLGEGINDVVGQESILTEKYILTET